MLPADKQTPKIWRCYMLKEKTFHKQNSTNSVTKNDFDGESDLQGNAVIPPPCYSAEKIKRPLFFPGKTT